VKVNNIESIDAYISGFPIDVQTILRAVRKTIRQAAPNAQEAIKYRIPAFTLGGPLIYFAGFKKHIGLYPAPRSAPGFKKELARYDGGKGTVQFPLDEPIPFDLITRIVKFRAKENAKLAAARRKKRKER
jgi:uncharacterized protein YdhG (YjbR/CyaY superfamily)